MSTLSFLLDYYLRAFLLYNLTSLLRLSLIIVRWSGYITNSLSYIVISISYSTILLFKEDL